MSTETSNTGKRRLPAAAPAPYVYTEMGHPNAVEPAVAHPVRNDPIAHTTKECLRASLAVTARNVPRARRSAGTNCNESGCATAMRLGPLVTRSRGKHPSVLAADGILRTHRRVQARRCDSPIRFFEPVATAQGRQDVRLSSGHSQPDRETVKLTQLIDRACGFGRNRLLPDVLRLPRSPGLPSPRVARQWLAWGWPRACRRDPRASRHLSGPTLRGRLKSN